MNSNEIIKILKPEKQFLKDNFGVERIALFGSYAKGIQKMDSDIDFFIELQKPDYSLLMGLYLYLEAKFDSKIDIVRKGPHLSKRFLSNIEKELIDV